MEKDGRTPTTATFLKEVAMFFLVGRWNYLLWIFGVD